MEALNVVGEKHRVNTIERQNEQSQLGYESFRANANEEGAGRHGVVYGGAALHGRVVHRQLQSLSDSQLDD